ncbi:MAG: SRPBCC family protein [Actinomycetota bacterium]|nr:SRPBCC family protein [Actinomycetota bacterium]MDK1016785.1 SRPBCC family protein [Actinomycetota bacterium]MDK1026500.1 SRPBCC family protein [Actinomycetota bacterium]MDK1037976.1 SRPBCC family protein [Actinomycetota bacterium]MDK1096060.1 SRPBCC family protein [Actinomycetota bacterium]
MIAGTVQSVEVSAAPQHVYEVALDLEAYTEWAGGVKSVVITSEDDYGRPATADFVVDGMIKEISYTLKYDYAYDNGFAWSAVPNSDLKSLDGRYEFNSLGENCCEVVYALKVDPAFTVPGFLRRQAEKQIVGTALRGLKKRAEENA